MTHDYKSVLYSESDHIATITLNRADKRNAISYELIDDLIAALKQAAGSPAQVIILTGAGKAFCSGMDLDNLKQLTGRTHEQNIQDSETMASLFRTLYDFPKPTIAAVNGRPSRAGQAWRRCAISLWPLRKQSLDTRKSESVLCRPSFQVFLLLTSARSVPATFCSQA